MPSISILSERQLFLISSSLPQNCLEMRLLYSYNSLKLASRRFALENTPSLYLASKVNPRLASSFRDLRIVSRSQSRLLMFYCRLATYVQAIAKQIIRKHLPLQSTKLQKDIIICLPERVLSLECSLRLVCALYLWLTAITVRHLSVLINNSLSLKSYHFSRMKLKLYIFTSEIELECQDNLSPEELNPYCTVDSYYRQKDILHVRIKGLKTKLSTVKDELAPKCVKL